MALLLVAYDIANDRRRVKLHKLLTGYGVQVQESLFECDLDEASIRKLRRHLARTVRPDDNVRLYPLCQQCEERIADAQGNLRPAPPLIYLP